MVEISPALVEAGLRVVASDYRGAGWSSKPPAGYDKWTMAEDIHRLLRDHLEIAGPLIVVGHDIGGILAYVGSAASVVARTPTTTVPLKLTQGQHDLYIVFKNASARPDDVLMTVTAIRFVLDDPAGGSRSPQ